MASPRSRLFAILLLAALLVTPVVASAVAVWRAAHTDEARRIDHADAVIVFGAAQYGGEPSPVFRGRLDHGALLYERGFSKRILVLGAGRPGDEFTEAEAGERYLVSTGIPEGDVLASPEGSTTFESLQAAADLLEENDLDSAFLVSDPWHNLRIRRMARDLGIEGYASATWHSAARSQSTRFQGYVRETFAYLYYVAIERPFG